MKMNKIAQEWIFWIDCGGTFTDIVAFDGSQKRHVHKLLSHSPHYQSAVARGIEDIIGHNNFSQAIKEVRLGTTVATNAFLEKQGVSCALVTTLGHKDVLEIRHQARGHLFEIPIKKPERLYSLSTHVYERLNSKGEVLRELDEDIARYELERIKSKGITSLAISLMHANVNPLHELKLKEIAQNIGFDYVSLSHQVSPIEKYVARTETTVIDAYLTPYLKQYTEELQAILGIKNIFYMRSDGGLCTGEELKGHNALLSGPAGGLVGATTFARSLGHQKVLTFDMGGTSTDVALYDGKLTLEHEPEFHGLSLLSPMVDIHTVAAGGGSILSYDNGRFKVGPESAKAYPGPASYRNGGPLTVTDANLFLGNLKVDQFPKVFGPKRDQGLDEEIVKEKFEQLAQKIGLSAQEVAKGFLDVAVETMARAVKKVSIERGHDPKVFALVSFGGAGGQLAAKVAQKLKINTILIHPLSSVLSAYGMGQGTRSLKVQGVPLQGFTPLEKQLEQAFNGEDFRIVHSYLISPANSDFQLEVTGKTPDEAKSNFMKAYQEQFGLVLEDSLTITSLMANGVIENRRSQNIGKTQLPASKKTLKGPHNINENNTTIVVPDGWEANCDDSGVWQLTRDYKRGEKENIVKHDKKVELEIFYQRFQFIAELMGFTLQKLSQSVNIKERKDFSCALFTKKGELIANAPHIPVHLGSMGDVVHHIIQQQEFTEGDMFLCNSPQSGGTHLPDLTVVAPLFFEGKLAMWVASRGHHADIGGIAPGSMPGHSKTLQEEGVIIHSMLIRKDNELLIEDIKKTLQEAKYPARNVDLNLHDIKAKVAANIKGINQLTEVLKQYGVSYVESMAEELLDYSHRKILTILKNFPEGIGVKQITKERKIKVVLRKKGERAVFDFSGTSPRLDNNFNTPVSVVKAAVLFALRCLFDEDVPLNSGIMRSIELKIPEDCFLNPSENSAVVSGNVETSQALCDALFEALGFMANSQGTMNNLSFGNDRYQYYETMAGGSGATATAPGTSGVQVHMTNSHLTDPEVFEKRLPVLIELMALRTGSGGVGKFLGGDGLYRRLLFLEDMSVNMISQSRSLPPKGLQGAGPAQRGINAMEEKNGAYRELEECFTQELKAGDRLYVDTPGGGGHGHSKDQNTLVFSFGSNMDIFQVYERCPQAQIMGRAIVFDKELRYSLYSKGRKGGVADMTDSPGKRVYGLILALNEKDLTELDCIECGISHYQRITTTAVNDNGEEIECYTYDVIDKEPDVPPHKLYEWHLYSGAYLMNVPQSYLKSIVSIPLGRP